jgi:NADH:ubiquinone oxidoreductase subunit 3 (subunit A)
MYFDYLIALVFAAVGIVFVFANLILASILRPKRRGEVGLETYECGELTIGDAWIRFDIRYYTVALVYIVFAVEIAFLFPWAMVMKDALGNTGVAAGAGIGVFALVEGVVFIAILFIGLAYVWAKGDLDWVLTYTGLKYVPKEERRRTRLASVAELEEAAVAAGKAAPHAAPTPSPEPAH